MKNKTQKKFAAINIRIMLLVFLMVVMQPFVCHSSVPQEINYQGFLTDSVADPVNGSVSILFSIYNVDSGGTPLWSETQPAVTVTDGIYSVILGSVIPIGLPFDVQYYLGINVNTDGEMTPRQPLTSVGYSFRAAKADAVAAGAIDTTEISDNAITGVKIASGEVVKSLNSLTDDITLAAGADISITPAGNTLTFNYTGSGGGDMFKTNYDSNADDQVNAADWADDAGLLDGNASSFYTNASNLVAGTVPSASLNLSDSDIPDTITVSNYLLSTGKAADADKLDGLDSTNFAGASHNHDGSDITSGTVAEPRIDAAIARDSEIMTTVFASDGTGSGLDADLLDGNDSSAFSPAVHNHNGLYFTETELSTSGGGSSVHWDNLTSVPSGLSDGDDDNDFSLPYNKSVSSLGSAFQITQTGTGRVAYFGNTASATSPALYVSNSGVAHTGMFIKVGATEGVALYGEILPGANSSYAILGKTSASGPAGGFLIDNAVNSSNALQVITNGTGNAGYFKINNGSNTSDALYAETIGTGNAGYFNGDVKVNGKVAYVTPRTHYFSVGGEDFVPDRNVDYLNGSGQGGAYINENIQAGLSAPIHLPHGAIITEFKLFFYDNVADNITVSLARMYFTGGYNSMAEVTSSGTPEYSNGTDSSILYGTIDNTTYSYNVRCFRTWSPDVGSNLRIMGAVIKYTIAEAP